MSTMESIEVLVLPQVPDEVLHRIQNIDRRVGIIDARGWFDIGLRATWPQWTVERYLGARTYPATSLEERNRVLASARIVLTGWPPLKVLRARAPRLKWVHELPAGASNFLETDLWGSDVLVTTSRGLTNRRPMAEFVLASFLRFARLESSDLLLDLLGQSEFVAICCPWTKETTHLIGRAAFAAMKSETVLVNIARGEIIDEEALLQALADGRLRGVALDVYEGEFEHPPDSRLWNDERVVITPHV